MWMHELSTTEKLVLLAIIVETKYGCAPSTTSKVYARYVELARLCKMQPITHRRALDVLKNLAGMGIVSVKVRSLGRYGRTSIVVLLQPPASLCQELVEDLLIGELAEEICRG